MKYSFYYLEKYHKVFFRIKKIFEILIFSGIIAIINRRIFDIAAYKFSIACAIIQYCNEIYSSFYDFFNRLVRFDGK